MDEKKQNQSTSVKRRGIVYIYGFEWCNPNGDPSFDNEPRMFNDRLFISDVFLKRRIRDYVASKGYEIFIKEIIDEKGNRRTPEKRLLELLGKDKIGDTEYKNVKEEILKKCWDLRVFGCLIPLPGKEKEEKGKSIRSIGPVQVSFGVSLNSVEKFDVSITNVMASTEERKKGGAIGKKYVVPIAIVEHFIFVNDITAQETHMSEEDYNLLIEALKNLKMAPTVSTSSKNVTPLLIIEIEYNQDKYLNPFGIVRVFEKKDENKEVVSLRGFEIDISQLVELLNSEKDVVKEFKIYVKAEFKEIIKGLERKELKEKISYF